MKKSKSELIQELSDTINIIKPHLEDCKIPKDYIDIHINLQDATYEQVLLAVKWLRNIPYNKYLEVLKMMSIEVRESLLKIGMYTQHRYFISLNIARKEFYKAIRTTKKPIIFKKPRIRSKNNENK